MTMDQLMFSDLEQPKRKYDPADVAVFNAIYQRAQKLTSESKRKEFISRELRERNFRTDTDVAAFAQNYYAWAAEQGNDPQDQERAA